MHAAWTAPARPTKPSTPPLTVLPSRISPSSVCTSRCSSLSRSLHVSHANTNHRRSTMRMRLHLHSLQSCSPRFECISGNMGGRWHRFQGLILVRTLRSAIVSACPAWALGVPTPVSKRRVHLGVENALIQGHVGESAGRSDREDLPASWRSANCAKAVRSLRTPVQPAVRRRR